MKSDKNIIVRKCGTIKIQKFESVIECLIEILTR
jgi:hypothetical protein